MHDCQGHSRADIVDTIPRFHSVDDPIDRRDRRYPPIKPPETARASRPPLFAPGLVRPTAAGCRCFGPPSQVVERCGATFASKNKNRQSIQIAGFPHRKPAILALCQCAEHHDAIGEARDDRGGRVGNRCAATAAATTPLHRRGTQLARAKRRGQPRRLAAIVAVGGKPVDVARVEPGIRRRPPEWPSAPA